MYKNAVETFLKLKLISLIRDDQAIDQIHHKVTTVILLFLAVFFSAKTKWGGIDCWIPKEYDSDNFKHYINQYCWISNLYRVPFSEELPVEVDERMSLFRSINFFRWVFLMFIVQAVMFKFPNYVWRVFNTFSGINIRKVVEQSLKTQMDSEKNRDANMTNLAIFIERWVKRNRRFDHGRFGSFRTRFSQIFFCFGRRSGCFLARLYLFVKLLYLGNLLVQFQILSVFLHFNYWAYGAEVASMIGADEPWKDLHHFPRVGMCDMEIRQLQNIQRHTVQCALPINMFLEKAYAFLWFYMVILGIFTFMSLVSLVLEEISSARREKFLHKYMKWLGEDSNSGLFKRFVRKYLRDDGIFLLKLLTYNTGEILTYDLIKQLWTRFKEQHPDDESVPVGHFKFPIGNKLFKRLFKHAGVPETDLSFDIPADEDVPPVAKAMFSKIKGLFN